MRRNTDAHYEALADKEIERKAQQKAKESREKQRVVRTGLQLMADVNALQKDFNQEKSRINLLCQQGNFIEAERFIKVMDAALKNIRGVK
jgi:hypothetical protein